MALGLWVFGLLASACLVSANIFGEFSAGGQGTGGGRSSQARAPKSDGLSAGAFEYLGSHEIPTVSRGGLFALSFTEEETGSESWTELSKSQSQWLVDMQWETRSS